MLCSVCASMVVAESVLPALPCCCVSRLVCFSFAFFANTSWWTAVEFWCFAPWRHSCAITIPSYDISHIFPWSHGWQLDWSCTHDRLPYFSWRISRRCESRSSHLVVRVIPVAVSCWASQVSMGKSVVHKCPDNPYGYSERFEALELFGEVPIFDCSARAAQSYDILLDIPSSLIVTVSVVDARMWYGLGFRQSCFEYQSVACLFGCRYI